MQEKRSEMPKIVSPYSKLKIKESVGLWNLLCRTIETNLP